MLKYIYIYMYIHIHICVYIYKNVIFKITLILESGFLTPCFSSILLPFKKVS